MAEDNDSRESQDRDDRDTNANSNALQIVQAPPPKEVDSVLALKQLSPDDLVVFRVCQKRPSLRKRPTSHNDGILSDDIVFSQYEVISICDGQLTVKPQPSTDPALASLFSGDEQYLNQLVGHLQHWTVVGGTDFSLKMPPNLEKSEKEIIQILFDARAFSGSFVTYSTEGFNSTDDGVASQLVSKGYVEKDGPNSLQLSTRLVQNGAAILGNPCKTFSNRIGVPFDASQITRNVKPTALEVQIKLREEGWTLETITSKKRCAPYRSLS